MGSTSASDPEKSRPKLERVMGIEPTSSAWKAEVLPLNYTRADGRPICRPNLTGPHRSPTEMWRGKDSNLRRRKPADLQSAPVGRLGTPPQNEPRILISGSWRVNACWPVICLGVGRREADRPGGAARVPPAAGPQPGPRAW